MVPGENGLKGIGQIGASRARAIKGVSVLSNWSETLPDVTSKKPARRDAEEDSAINRDNAAIRSTLKKNARTAGV